MLVGKSLQFYAGDNKSLCWEKQKIFKMLGTTIYWSENITVLCGGRQNYFILIWTTIQFYIAGDNNLYLYFGDTFTLLGIADHFHNARDNETFWNFLVQQ